MMFLSLRVPIKKLSLHQASDGESITH